MAINIGPRIGVDGEAEYRKQMNNIIQQAKTLSSEMKVVAASFDKNDKSMEKSTAQSAVLTKQIEVQKERLALLSDMLKKSADKYGENDANTLKYKQAVNETTATIKEMERSLNDTGDAMDNAGGKAVSLGDLIKANIISDAIIGGIKMVASAAAEMGKALGSAFVDVSKQALYAYADYEQLAGGVETLFKEAADVVKNDASEAFRTAGLSANEYMDTVTSFSASLISGLGGDTKKAAEIANMAITDMADNANKMGTDISGIQNAYQGFAKQTYTMLDNLKLGYGGTQAEMARLINDSGVLGDTIEVTAKTVNDVSFDKIVEAIHVVQKQMGVTGTTAEEAASTIQGSVSSMKSAWENFLAGIGDPSADMDKLVKDLVDTAAVAVNKNIIPRLRVIVPTLIDGIGEIASEMSPYITEAIEMLAPAISEAAEALGPAFQELFRAVYPVIQDALGQIGELITSGLVNGVLGAVEPILPAITGITTAIGTFVLALNFSSIVQTVSTALGAMKTAALGVNAALAANPIGIVVALIAGLVTAVITLWNTNDEFRAAIIEIWESLKAKINECVNSIIGFFNNLKNKATEIANGIKTAFSNMKTAVQETVSGIASAVIDGIGRAVSYITSLPGKALGWGRDFIQGFIDGITSKIGGIISAVRGIGSTIRKYLHFSRPDMGPLRDYETWMPDFVQGMADGIKANAYKLENAVSQMAGGMTVNLSGIGGGNSNSNTFNITVTAAEGQSEQAIAEIVMQKIQHAVRQREMAFNG